MRINKTTPLNPKDQNVLAGKSAKQGNRLELLLELFGFHRVRSFYLMMKAVDGMA